MQTETTNRKKGKLEAAGVAPVVTLIAFALIFGCVLFLAAGRLDWLEGWFFSGTFLAHMVFLSVWGIPNDPELLNERGRAFSKKNVKGREKALVLFVAFLQLAMLVVAGLDRGRFRWSTVPLAVEVVGFPLLILTTVLPAWTMMTNTFASVVVRVQDERGHQVVQTGSYRYVRHPMYVGVILMGLSVPLALGSWWALMPGGTTSLLFVFRTAAEDRMLQDQLPGYAEYARKVCFRLLPVVW